jgi:hypothetical protein
MPHAPLRSANKALGSGLVKIETRFHQAFLLLLVTAISAAFVAMIRAFLLTILPGAAGRGGWRPPNVMSFRSIDSV